MSDLGLFLSPLLPPSSPQLLHQATSPHTLAHVMSARKKNQALTNVFYPRRTRNRRPKRGKRTEDEIPYELTSRRSTAREREREGNEDNKKNKNGPLLILVLAKPWQQRSQRSEKQHRHGKNGTKKERKKTYRNPKKKKGRGGIKRRRKKDEEESKEREKV